jgi:hypothetical protein
MKKWFYIHQLPKRSRMNKFHVKSITWHFKKVSVMWAKLALQLQVSWQYNLSASTRRTREKLNCQLTYSCSVNLAHDKMPVYPPRCGFVSMLLCTITQVIFQIIPKKKFRFMNCTLYFISLEGRRWNLFDYREYYKLWVPEMSSSC